VPDKFEYHPYLWQAGVMLDLESLGGDFSFAGDINERGQVVGGSQNTLTAERRAFLWEKGVVTDLGSLGGVDPDATAMEINERGQIVGFSSTASGEIHAALWTK
jgi:probable HAF family extracellular repeat protein